MSGIGKPNNKMTSPLTGIESTVDENIGVNFVGAVDNVDLERGLISLRGFEAGSGISLTLIDVDGNFGTAEQMIRIESTATAIIVDGVIDADGDTILSVEKTPDNDTLTLDIGDNTGNFTGLSNQLTWSTSGIAIASSSALPAAGAIAGAPISITSGSGGNTGSGGNIDIAAGDSGILAGQAGRVTIRTADKPAGAIGNGGDIRIDAGNSSSGQGGRLVQSGGDGGTTGFGGPVFISGGRGGTTSGAGGTLTLRGGSISGTGGAGGVAAVGGIASSGQGGPVLLQPGRSSTGGAANFGWVVVGADATAPATGEFRFKDTVGSGNDGYVGFKGPLAAPSNQIWTLPAVDGASGDALTTDGAGTLSWAAGGGGSSPTIVGTRAAPSITDGTATIVLPPVASTNILFVQSNGGAVIATAVQQFSVSTTVGDTLTVIGRSDVDTVQYNNDGILELNGPIILGQSDVLNLMWDGAVWLETGRNI